jgi:diguanylate cyclase (GGDEF)-like protein
VQPSSESSQGAARASASRITNGRGQRLRYPSEPTLPAVTVGEPPSDPGRRPTPLLPPRPIRASRSRATLLVLTGPEAGRVVVLQPAGLIIGRDDTCGLQIDDLAVSRRHARLAAGPDGSFYVEDLGSTNGTFVGTRRVSWSPLAPGDSLRLGPESRFRFAMSDDAEHLLQRRIYESSVRDPLTEVFNRRYFEERLTNELQRVASAGGDSTVLLIDVDDLKSINDRYGHLAGDRALKTVAATMARIIRPQDVLARLGGDEFAVLVAGADHELGTRLALRALDAVARCRCTAGRELVALTVSVGVASVAELGPVTSPRLELLAVADRRLYEAKRAGRNRVSASAGRMLPNAPSSHRPAVAGHGGGVLPPGTGTRLRAVQG